jgi:hypothetical protein
MKYIIILFIVMFYGFQWYAGALKAWPRMVFIPRLFTLIGVAFFGSLDVVFMNVVVGTVVYADIPFRAQPDATKWWHRQWTFSQRTEFWYNESQNDWRKTYLLGADNWTALLNAIAPGHITKRV